MLEIVIGILSGIISAIGMGGGTILILLLVYTMQIEQHVAQASNLIFFIPTAIIAIIINRKQNLLDLKTGLIVGGTGIVGAVIGSIISKNINDNILRKIFGIFLAIIVIYEIFSYIKLYIKKKNTNNTIKQK